MFSSEGEGMEPEHAVRIDDEKQLPCSVPDVDGKLIACVASGYATYGKWRAFRFYATPILSVGRLILAFPFEAHGVVAGLNAQEGVNLGTSSSFGNPIAGGSRSMD
ncbi:Hypothetical predicted protein [Olea europaea subsp. europaea]|uniref:Uncharacterized protein n=1 Tax=Olea europaea subsp. europaea TaxID=158383 RepID=A0A8S0UZR6_OLEEU|nr:Hypothetical predicted protein [Olea europaea subsp. europaea]